MGCWCGGIGEGFWNQAAGLQGAPRPGILAAVVHQGQGKGTANIPVTLADTATYYVNIHDAAAAMGIIVACGDLTKK